MLYVAPQWQPVFRELGIDADAVFTHPQIHCWRRLGDRENCTLDAQLADGRSIRLHVKRYAPGHGAAAAGEQQGFRLLEQHAIPTAPLVAWGSDGSDRSFTITADLAGFDAADKLIERGGDFERLLEPIARLAAKLHDAGLHHRDLYLCHFFAKVQGEGVEVRLIDVARVRQLPRLFPRRWIVKDLAQLWYSMISLPISETQRVRLMECYAAVRNIEFTGSFRSAIERKARWIGRHDRRLRRSQPQRNISIPPMNNSAG